MVERLISFVIPCYCSEHTITNVVDELIGEIKKQSTYDYEIILVNDCSKDNTMKVIKEFNNNKIVAIDFARNFGQHSAMMAAFREVRGEYVVCLDDDGQMPIESVFDLIEELEKGADIAFGQYDDVKQKWYRNIGSALNAKMTEVLLEKPKDLFMSSFWAGKRYIIDEVVKYEGAYPYIGGLLLRITRNMVCVPVKARERIAGKSGYTFLKLVNLWMNGFTAFSLKPLRFATFCGGVSAIGGFAFSIVSIIRKCLNPEILLGYTSLLAVLLFIGGMIMLLLGIMGEYIGRIYICINKAPQYVIKEIVDMREE